MDLALRALRVLLVVALAWWAVQMMAAESGEVVILTTTDAEGRPHETRLWIVDYDGAPWLRAGDEIAGWYQRLGESPEVVVERGGQVESYRALAEPWEREIINRLMAEKYGWAEWYIGLVFKRDHSIPIRLKLQEV